MPDSRLLYIFVFLLLSAACSKTIERDVIVDNIIYGIDTVPVYTSSAEKDKLKTPVQFVSTLYANLYFKPIPTNVLNDLSLIRLANGDKVMINDLIIASFIYDADVQSSIPDESEMHADVEDFVTMTYLRFFLRRPTAYELHSMKELINSDPEIQPEEVYRAFMLSNEYLYY